MKNNVIIETINDPHKKQNILDQYNNYINYFNHSVDLIDKDGLILIDNVLWHGEVADDKKNDKFTNIIREFNKHIKKDNRIVKNIIPIGDGLTICIKK